MMLSLWWVAVFAGLYGLFVWKFRSWAFAFMFFALPLYQVRFLFFAIPGTLLEVMILMSVVIVLFQERSVIVKTCKEEVKNARLHLSKWIISPTAIACFFIVWLLIASVIALFVTPRPQAGFGIFKAYIIEPMLLASVFPFVFGYALNRRIIIGSLMASVVVVSLVALFQYITGWGIPSPWADIDARRVVSVFAYPNAVGLYIAPILALLIGIAMHGQTLFETEIQRLRWRVLIIATAIIGFLGVLASRSDGAVIAIAAAVFVGFLFTRFRWIIGAAGVAVVSIGLSLEPVRRILFFEDVSGDVRKALWKGTWNLISHHPFVGSGLAGFPQTYNIYRLPSHVELLEYSHNLLFDFWTQLGLLGALWIVAVVVFGVIVTIRARVVTQGRSLFILTMLVAYAVYGLVDVPYFKNDLAVLSWFLFATIWWSYRSLRQGNMHR